MKIILNFQTKNIYPIILSLFSILYYCIYQIHRPRNAEVLGLSSTVKTNVYSCVLELNVKPEKRVANEWANLINIDIFTNDNNKHLGKFQTTTDSNGDALFNLCEDTLPPIYLQNNTYNFYVKGHAHLTKLFQDLSGFEQVYTKLELARESSNYLVAGDINTIQDDKVNSLDITHVIKHLGFQNGIDPEYDQLYDLNYDGIIDFQDAQILISNFYQLGDQIL
jgi:hypothetical protein